MTPLGRTNLDSNKLGRHPLEMFHAKKLSSCSLDFFKEDFLSYHYIHKGKINDPSGQGQF
jgi:hypothetical protein